MASTSRRAADRIIQLDSRSRRVGPTTIGRQRAHRPATNVSVTKFEPTMLPTAAAGWPRKDANSETQNSGSDVTTATSMTVTTSGDTRSQAASFGMRRRTVSVPPQSRAIPTRNSRAEMITAWFLLRIDSRGIRWSRAGAG